MKGLICAGGEATRLEVRFLVPATASSIEECYRATLAAVGNRPPLAERTSGRRAVGGTWGRKEAERVAHQAFLTLVSQAKGEIHCIEFEIATRTCELIAMG